MNRGAEILNQAKAARVLSESLEIVRKPWFLTWTPSASIIMSAALGCAFLAVMVHLPVGVGYAILVAAAVVACFMNQRSRDKAWKRLSEAQAPELGRRVGETRRE